MTKTSKAIAPGSKKDVRDATKLLKALDKKARAAPGSERLEFLRRVYSNARRWRREKVAEKVFTYWEIPILAPSIVDVCDAILKKVMRPCDRRNKSKYSATLRLAARKKKKASEFIDFVKETGGINKCVDMERKHKMLKPPMQTNKGKSKRR